MLLDVYGLLSFVFSINWIVLNKSTNFKKKKKRNLQFVYKSCIWYLLTTTHKNPFMQLTVYSTKNSNILYAQ